MTDKRSCENCENKECAHHIQRPKHVCNDWLRNPRMWLSIPPNKEGYYWFKRKNKCQHFKCKYIIHYVDSKYQFNLVNHSGAKWQGPIRPNAERGEMKIQVDNVLDRDEILQALHDTLHDYGGCDNGTLCKFFAERLDAIAKIKQPPQPKRGQEERSCSNCKMQSSCRLLAGQNATGYPCWHPIPPDIKEHPIPGKVDDKNLCATIKLKDAIEIIDSEPEFPGEMPQEMKNALLSGDIEVLAEALRIAVRLTKKCIKERMLEFCHGQGEG